MLYSQQGLVSSGINLFLLGCPIKGVSSRKNRKKVEDTEKHCDKHQYCWNFIEAIYFVKYYIKDTELHFNVVLLS